MPAAQRRWAADLLYFWFHRLEPSDWFGGSDAVDEQLTRRFGDLLASLGQRSAEEFLRERRTAQAAILLFDQVTRNVSRDSAAAFAYDHLAREICYGFLARGWDEGLPNSQRQFVAMPLMHSEQIADQIASVRYFARHLPGNLPFARSHFRMIARFGRFPHRNDLLGRKTTAAEQRAIEAGFSW